MDAVALFTAAPDHARHSVACLQRGEARHERRAGGDLPRGRGLLAETVRKTGLTMMAETSYYHQVVISAPSSTRKGSSGESSTPGGGITMPAWSR